VEAHATLPNLEDLQRMNEVVERLVEQHVAESTAQDHAEHTVEQHVVDVARMPARQQHLARAHAAEHHEQNESDEVHEPVPADRERPEDEHDDVELEKLQRDRVELWMNEHA